MKTRVQSIRKIKSLDLLEVVTADEDGHGEKVIRANDVFAMIPANHLLRILGSSSSLDVMDALKSIKFVSMGVVHVGFNADILRNEGFGYLVPSYEHEKILGVVYDSVAFPSQNLAQYQTRLSVMAGGAHCPWITSINKRDLEAIAFDALDKHLDISQRPDFVRPLILKECIPQYHVGFWKTLEIITTGLARTHSGLRIGGNSFCGVGIADCVSYSKKLALEYVQLFR
jgi:oxygen-dependent protoporphyrinogen oxidase